MAISIITNVASLSAQRNLGRAQEMQQSSVGRLSSGLRINKAADDAAGLGISESLRADIRSISQAKRNASDGISLTQVAEGAMNEVQGIVSRMRELAVQSANGTLGTTERGYIQTEFSSLRSEINRISSVTEFNGTKLIDGTIASGSGSQFQVGIHNTSNDRLTMAIATITASALGSGTMIGSLSLSSASGAQSAIGVFDAAIKQLSTARAGIGAMQNRLSVTMNNLSVSHENLSAAESRVRDVDVAEETSALTRSQILSQASISLLSQANQLPGAALSLLG